MPPPPWELSVTLIPSILDGLHQKLLGNGFFEVVRFVPQSVALRTTASAGICSARFVGISVGLENFTPLPKTVIPAPSYAPIRLGSESCSGRLPFKEASQPTMASRSIRSIANCIAAEQVNFPFGS